MIRIRRGPEPERLEQAGRLVLPEADPGILDGASSSEAWVKEWSGPVSQIQALAPSA